MSIETLYLLRKSEPRTAIGELDDVVLLIDAVSDGGDVIPAGADGTVVAVWGGGEALEVEFSEPEGALATVSAANLRRVGHYAA